MLDDNTRSFDAIKPSYEKGIRRLPWATQAAVLRHAIRQLEIQPGDNVLDVCAGTGSNIESIVALTGEGGTVTGVELSQGVLRLAEQKFGQQRNVHLVHGDVADLKGYDSSFDQAFMSFCLHSMHLARRLRVIHGVCRMLKASGTLVIVDYFSILGRRNRGAARAGYPDGQRAEDQASRYGDLRTILVEGGCTHIEDVEMLSGKLTLVKAMKAAGATATGLQNVQRT